MWSKALPIRGGIFIHFSMEGADHGNTVNGILSFQIVMFRLVKHMN